MLENVPYAEHQGGMRTLTQLQQNRRVIQDFTATTLAGIPGLYARLVYIASLLDLSSGRYEHAGLAALYPEAAIQQALQLCHEHILERILETPLSSQEHELRACLPDETTRNGFHREARRNTSVGNVLWASGNHRFSAPTLQPARCFQDATSTAFSVLTCRYTRKSDDSVRS